MRDRLRAAKGKKATPEHAAQKLVKVVPFQMNLQLLLCEKIRLTGV